MPIAKNASVRTIAIEATRLAIAAHRRYIERDNAEGKRMEVSREVADLQRAWLDIRSIAQALRAREGLSWNECESYEHSGSLANVAT